VNQIHILTASLVTKVRSQKHDVSQGILIRHITYGMHILMLYFSRFATIMALTLSLLLPRNKLEGTLRLHTPFMLFFSSFDDCYTRSSMFIVCPYEILQIKFFLLICGICSVNNNITVKCPERIEYWMLIKIYKYASICTLNRKNTILLGPLKLWSKWTTVSCLNEDSEHDYKGIR
jgi:accessory gene regulator protein AgrB